MENLRLNEQCPEYLIHKVNSRAKWPDSNIFNRNEVFMLQNFYHLRMLFLIYKVTAGGTKITAPSPASAYFMENIYLESNGQIIGKVNTTYTLYRLKQYDSLTYQSLLDQMGSNGFAANTTTTVKLPLFFWAIDGQLIDLTKYKNLTIRHTTKPSKEKMGFNLDPSALSTELEQIYNIYKEPLSKQLKNPYNIYQQPTVTVPKNTTETNILINLPYEITNIILMARKAAAASSSLVISNVLVEYTNGRTESYDSLTSFTIDTDERTNPDLLFIIRFGNRKDTTKYIKSNENMNPLKLKLTHSDTGATDPYDLFVCCEYKSDIKEYSNNSGLFMLETLKEGYTL